MEFRCHKCGTPLVSGSAQCQRCGLRFPQPVPGDNGKNGSTVIGRLKQIALNLMRGFAGLCVLAGIAVGATGDSNGAVLVALFGLPLAWSFTKLTIKHRGLLTLLVLGVTVTLIGYSNTSSGRIAHAKTEQQIEADRRKANTPAPETNTPALKTDTSEQPSSATSETEQPAENAGATLMNIGEEGYLSDGRPSLVIAVDEDALKALEDVDSANDTVGLDNLVASERVFTVENRTRAKLLDFKFPGRSEIRITSGPHINELGWVATECLKQGDDTPALTTSNSAGTAAQTSNLFGIKPGFKATYQVIKREDMSMANASRWTVRIALPAHLTRKEEEQNIRYAAKEQWDRNQPNALTVFAYRNGSDYEGPVTAGQCDYAPYGDWSRASEPVTLDQYKLVIQLEDGYFSAR